VKVDSEMAVLAYDLATDAGKVGKEVIEDSKVIYTAAEDITLATVNSYRHEKGAIGTVKDLQNVFVDLGTITSLAQDQEHAKKINNATELNERELEQTVDGQQDYMQAKEGIDPEKRARVHLYQGDDQAFEEGPAKNLRNYKGGYDTQNNKVYVNTDKTDISNGSDIQKVLFTEQQRKENNSNPLLKNLDDKQQKALAYDRGDRAAKNWARFSNPSTKSNPVAANNWNERNRDSLKKNNEWISQVDGKQVKPRVLEKFDKRYWSALKRGDNEEAARIKAEWEAVENKTIQTAVNIITSNGLPILEVGAGAFNAFGSNLVGGIGRKEDGSLLFQQGQFLGDIASFITGGAEVVAGSGMVAGGAGSIVVTGGGSVFVGSPAVIAGGVIVTAHGLTVVNTALNNLNRPFNLTSQGDKRSQSNSIQNNKGEPVGQGEVVGNSDAKGSLSETKEALIKAKKELGLKQGESLPKGKQGKFGSPQRGNAQKGYRLDPSHTNAKPGSGEEYPHVNWWDYSKGKRGNGGRSGVIPIKKKK